MVWMNGKVQDYKGSDPKTEHGNGSKIDVKKWIPMEFYKDLEKKYNKLWNDVGYIWHSLDKLYGSVGVEKLKTELKKDKVIALKHNNVEFSELELRVIGLELKLKIKEEESKVLIEALDDIGSFDGFLADIARDALREVDN